MRQLGEFQVQTQWCAVQVKLLLAGPPANELDLGGCQVVKGLVLSGWVCFCFSKKPKNIIIIIIIIIIK
jgi:hypothetical protein